MTVPTRDELIQALETAGAAHHEYQTNALQGVPDEQWPGWYAAYVLGRVGDFVEPSVLANWLATAPASENWTASAVTHIEEQLQAT